MEGQQAHGRKLGGANREPLGASASKISAALRSVRPHLFIDPRLSCCTAVSVATAGIFQKKIGGSRLSGTAAFHGGKPPVCFGAPGVHILRSFIRFEVCCHWEGSAFRTFTGIDLVSRCATKVSNGLVQGAGCLLGEPSGGGGSRTLTHRGRCSTTSSAGPTHGPATWPRLRAGPA